MHDLLIALAFVAMIIVTAVIPSQGTVEKKKSL
jgi:hypothetical protein